MRNRKTLIALAACLVLLSPSAARADNCGDFNDCMNVIKAALSVLVGVTVVAALLLTPQGRLLLGLMGVIESLTGKSLLTGDQLARWERILGVTPFGRVSKLISRAANVGKLPKGVLSNTKIRQWYVDTVKRIPDLNARLIKHGVSAEERAKVAWQIRHNARLEARGAMKNSTEVELLRQRDLAKYGNPDGPSFEHLVEKAKAAGLKDDEVYEAIIRGSHKTDAGVDVSLGL